MSKKADLTKLRRLSKEIDIELEAITDDEKHDNPDAILEEIEDLISRLEVYQGSYW